MEEFLKDVIEFKDINPELLGDLDILKRPKGNKRRLYYDIVCAFDIETTNLDDYDQAIMYIWQFQYKQYTIIGRTWDEFKAFVEMLKDRYPDAALVVLVHNLSFEWQFLKSIISVDKVFAMDDRKVLYFISNNLEFRCTYLHSNMKLEEYVKRMNSQYHKLSGFDYDKKRYSWTPLSDDELLYCIMDVKALVDAYKNQMELDEDNLYTIPYTSTGYVRRLCKDVLKPYHSMIHMILPDEEVFHALRKAFRGGNTHANRWNSDILLDNVTSYDISSSYPSIICTEEFPMGFVKRNPNRLRMALKFGYACLMHIYLEDVKLLDESFGCPYLAKGKVEHLYGAELDNGRILSCESCDLWITEIDLKILTMEYSFNYEVLELYTAPKKKLPKEFIDLVLTMYSNKTVLKGTGDDYQYSKYKELLNSIYGMMVQNPCKLNYILDGHDLVMDEDETIEDLIKKYNNYGWIAYQWGVYVCASARYKLEIGIHSIPYEAFVYADTDSIKFLGDYGKNIEELNKMFQHEELKAYDKKGNSHYMGIFEYETTYKRFKTMGAKKYVYEDMDGKLNVTISGVNKELGAKELGKIENFKEGFTFKEAGGRMAVYNDYPEVKEIIIDGHKVPITSNVALLPSTYTLGLTADYERLLRILCNSDIRYSLHYER